MRDLLQKSDGRAVEFFRPIDHFDEGVAKVRAVKVGGLTFRVEDLGDHAEVYIESGDGQCFNVRDLSEWKWAPTTEEGG